MDWSWNWGGECFGYRDGDSLFAYFGKEVGRFGGEEIYGSLREPFKAPFLREDRECRADRFFGRKLARLAG
jgi:hypothetical protein